MFADGWYSCIQLPCDILSLIDTTKRYQGDYLWSMSVNPPPHAPHLLLNQTLYKTHCTHLSSSVVNTWALINPPWYRMKHNKLLTKIYHSINYNYITDVNRLRSCEITSSELRREVRKRQVGAWKWQTLLAAVNGVKNWYHVRVGTIFKHQH